MNHTACECGGESVAVPFLFLAMCLSLSSLFASFFTHKKLLLLLLKGQSTDGQREYGRIPISST